MSSFVYLQKEASSKNAPLLILLHGYGSNEADLFSFARYIPADFHVVSLRAPLSLGFGHAWFPIHFDASMERWTDEKDVATAVSYVTDFIDEYAAKASIDNKRVYLVGFSQGAMLSLSVGLHNEYVKGIAAMSGYLDTRIKKPTNKTNLPIYISHGDADDVVPYSWSATSVNRLKEFGYTPDFYTYAQGHSINQENLSGLILWLEELT